MKTIEQLYDFQGKVFIISGAAGAIGSEVARFLSSLGAYVALADLNKEKVFDLAKDIQNQTGNATFAKVVDFTQESQIQELVEDVVGKFGKISGVINNVGWGSNTPLFGSDSQKMIDAYKLNTLSAYHLTKFCMPYLSQEDNACVLFSGSAVGNTPSPEFIEYSTAKAGLLNMARSMAVASGPQVRFNTIIIGSVDNGESSKNAGYTQEMMDKVASSIVMKRRGVPQDVAYSMAFLLSQGARWITGAELRVDGGGAYSSKMP